MRLALVHPTYWPEVRRGSERLVHDLAAALVDRGHEVTILTSHRSAPRSDIEDGVRVVRSWRPPEPPGLALHEFHVANAPTVFARVLSGRFDVVHAFFPSDAYAAVLARRLGGPPVVATLHGVPVRQYLVARRYRLEMLLTVARGADECSVLSRAAARPFRDYLLREPRILTGGVRCGDYAAAPSTDPGPSLLLPASIGDPRKRGGLLARAFSRARREHPALRLRVAPGRDPVMSPASIPLPDGAELIETPDDAALAGAYGRASVTVLPSVHEAFGLVLIESMAAGTPVLATASGAAPEVVTRETGVLVEPDDEDALVQGIGAALELAARPETAERCRERARAFDWSAVVREYERVYEGVLKRPSRGRAADRRDGAS